ncbi:MAG: hypothetical protein U0996_16455 [Planctomycetaceae bacterium]
MSDNPPRADERTGAREFVPKVHGANDTWTHRALSRCVAGLVWGALGVLLVLSLGSGWTFPNLLPDRMDAGPWRQSFAVGSGLLRSLLVSCSLSCLVAATSTTAGLLLARQLRHSRGPLVLYFLYLPFVISPVIAGICLYDLMIRLHLAGTFVGVLLIQSAFATSFATIFFRSAFSDRMQRLEDLIRTLGGNRATIWRHAIWPQCRGLIRICLIQTALFSWLDYGLVSVIGGGQVIPVTVRLFSLIREASTNQAALASLVLLLPAILAMIFALVIRATAPSLLAPTHHVAMNAADRGSRSDG